VETSVIITIAQKARLTAAAAVRTLPKQRACDTVAPTVSPTAAPLPILTKMS